MPSSLFVLHSLLVTICALLCVTIAFAQKAAYPEPAIKFGKITPDQFVYSLTDTTAEAVVLYNYGEVTFYAQLNGIWLDCHYHVRTQIRKKSAYDRATIQLLIKRGVSGPDEIVSEFNGQTYNLVDGKILIDQLTSASHFSEKVSDQFWIEKYTLPNIREGSIIDYEYTVRRPFSVAANRQTWYFQQDIPVIWSEYRITTPDSYMQYKVLLDGYLEMAINERKSANVYLFPNSNGTFASAYRFVMKDIPAFRNEVYTTTPDDYIAKIDFELASYRGTHFSTTWEDIDKALLASDEFGGQMKRAAFLRETAKALLAQHSDTLSRITAAYDFIRHTIKWNDEAALIPSDGLKKIFDNKKGNAADINLMLISLLRSMSVDAHPVILSTRSHGRLKAFAFIKNFNYVIAQISVGGKDMLLDATDSFLKPGMLPLHCLNAMGRLVHPTKARFVSLTPQERDAEVYNATFTLTEEGDLSGLLRHAHIGYGAWNARKLFATQGQEKYLETIQKSLPAWQIKKTDVSGVDLQTNSFNTDYTISIPEACSQGGDRFYFHPIVTEEHTENPFKEPDRRYPVDFGVLIEETFMFTYTLPGGFQVEEMPKSLAISLPKDGGRFTYQATINTDKQLQVVSRLQLRRTKYLADEYPALREMFTQMVAKHAEQIVLKREAVTEKK